MCIYLDFFLMLSLMFYILYFHDFFILFLILRGFLYTCKYIVFTVICFDVL